MRHTIVGNDTLSWMDVGAAKFASGLFSLIPKTKNYSRIDIEAVIRADSAGAPLKEPGLDRRETELIRLVSFTSQVFIAALTFAVMMGLSFLMGSLATSSEEILHGRSVLSLGLKSAAFLIAVADVVLLVLVLYRTTSRSLRAIS